MGWERGRIRPWDWRIGIGILCAAAVLLIPLALRRKAPEPALHPSLPPALLARIDQEAAVWRPSAERLLQGISQEVQSLTPDTPERVRRTVQDRLLGIRSRLRDLKSTLGDSEQARAAGERAFHLYMKQAAPSLPGDWEVLRARLPAGAEGDDLFPDLKRLWHGRALPPGLNPDLAPAIPVPVFVSALMGSPLSAPTDSLDGEIAKLAAEIAGDLKNLAAKTLEQLSQLEGSSDPGVQGKLATLGNQTLSGLAGLEDKIQDRLGRLETNFGVTDSDALGRFAAASTSTLSGPTLVALRTAIGSAESQATAPAAQASLSTDLLGIDQLSALLGGQRAALSLDKLIQVISLARDVAADLQSLVTQANQRLDQIDQAAAGGTLPPAAQDKLGALADRIVSDAGRISQDIAQGVARISADPVPPGIVQAALASQLRLQAPNLGDIVAGLIARLENEMANTPSAALKAKLASAILALRQLDRSFDTTPAAVAITAPSAGAILNQIPAISLTLSDSGSGPDPASLRLLATSDAPGNPTVDLTGFLQITRNDPVAGVVTATASNLPPTALPDGVVTLQASGTDLAGNPPATATLSFVLDRQPPVITILSPADGSFLNSPNPAISATVKDAGGAGINAASIMVTLDGVPLAATVTLSDPMNATVSATPPQPLGEGPHHLTIEAKDLATNDAVANSAFVVDVTPPVILNLLPAPGTFTNQASPAVSATITDQGGSGIDPTSVILRLDGAPVAATVTPIAGGAVSVAFLPPQPLSEGAHLLALDARDRAGNAAQTAQSNFLIDLTPPVISGLMPPNGGFATPTPAISAVITDSGGSGLDPASIIVTLDGSSIPASVTLSGPNNASVQATPGSPLAGGLHTLTISASDRAGNAAVPGSSTFAIDLVPPTILLTAPGNGSFTNNPKPPVAATITDTGGSGVDPASVVVRLDGLIIPASVLLSDPNTASVTAVPAAALARGPHLVTVDARDRAGNIASTASASFGIDLSPPAIQITAPPGGSATNNEKPTVSALVTDTGGSGVDPASLILRLNGASVAFTQNIVDPNTVTVTFTPNSPLAQGGYTVTMDGRDRAGNAAPTASSAFVLDITPPVISNLSPASGSFINNPQPTLSAMVKDSGGSGVDPTSIVVRLGGNPVSATVSLSDPNTALVTVAFPSPLSQGTYNFSVDARDRAGNAAVTQSSTFVLDLTAPVISNLAPAAGSFLNVARPVLSASITDTGGAGVDPASILVRLDGNPVAAAVSSSDPNTFMAAFTPAAGLAEGGHTISVDAKDRAGNQAQTASATFTIDLSPPAVSSLLPQDGSFTNLPRPPLSATITDTGGSGVNVGSIVLQLDGAAVAPVVNSANLNAVTLTFTPASALSEGLHTLKLDAQDRAGNAAPTANARFTVDLTAPVLSSPAPAPGSTATVVRPVISAAWTDALSGVVPGSAQILLDQGDITAAATVGPAGFSFTPSADLASGSHSVMATVKDAAGNTGSLSWSFLIGASSPGPSNFAGVAQSTSSILWSWSAFSGATGYQVLDNASNVVGTVGAGVTTFTEQNLQENAPTSRHVVAMIPFGSSGPSNTVVRFTLVHGATASDFTLVATSSTQVQITIVPPPNGTLGMTSAQVLQFNSDFFFGQLLPYSNVYVRFDNSAMGGVTSTDEIQFRNGDGIQSAPSPSKSVTPPVTPPPAPTGFSGLVKSTGSIQWSWSPVATATGYTVEDDLGTVKGTLQGQFTTSFLETGLGENSRVSRHVRGFNTAGPGAPSSSVALWTFVHDPTAADFIALASTPTQTKVVVVPPPNPTSGLTGCQIQRLENGVWTTVQDLTGLYTLMDLGLVSGTTYSYRIRLQNGAAIVSAYSPAQTATTPAAGSGPAGFAGTALSTGSILWSWNDVTGETGFVVHDDLHNPVGSVGQGVTTFTETGLAENTLASRHVHAVLPAGLSDASNTAARFTLVHDAALVDLAVSSSLSGEIDLVITPPPHSGAGQTGCEIQRSTDGQTWVVVKPFSSVYTFADTGLAPTTTYFYRIRFENGDGVAGGLSPSTSALTLPAAPVITSAARRTKNQNPVTAGTAQPLVTVEVFAGGISVGTVVSDASGGWALASGVKLADATYLFTARAHTAGNLVSGPSNAIAVTVDTQPPPAPANIRITQYSTCIDVQWDATIADDVAGYNVYRKTGTNGTWGLLNTTGMVLGTRYRDSTTQPGVQYVYRVTTLDNAQTQ